MSQLCCLEPVVTEVWTIAPGGAEHEGWTEQVTEAAFTISLTECSPARLQDKPIHVQGPQTHALRNDSFQLVILLQVRLLGSDKISAGDAA